MGTEHYSLLLTVKNKNRYYVDHTAFNVLISRFFLNILN